ncbi:MAG TPA: hypothetical protein VGY57_15880 [Vicinamibacterales bacterium]|nr:hypothetical protein [Vicinamibacterales bacterium]
MKFAGAVSIALVAVTGVFERAEEKHAVRVVRDIAYLPDGAAEGNTRSTGICPKA